MLVCARDVLSDGLIPSPNASAVCLSRATEADMGLANKPNHFDHTDPLIGIFMAIDSGFA